MAADRVVQCDAIAKGYSTRGRMQQRVAIGPGERRDNKCSRRRRRVCLSVSTCGFVPVCVSSARTVFVCCHAVRVRVVGDAVFHA